MSETTLRPRFASLLVLVAAAQTAALAYMLLSRDRLLKHGHEIVMQTQPVDPRDLLRGDYVTLGYAISQFNIAPQAVPPDLRKGDVFYAVLEKGTDDAWSVKRIAASYPKDAQPGELVLRGRIRGIFEGPPEKGSTVSARYGIESYFVPEGTGRVMEDEVRQHGVKAVVAVGSDGEAAIKGLIVDSVRTDLPPVF